ncbi:MAG: hypothetical protein V1889_00405 [archaeon]
MAERKKYIEVQIPILNSATNVLGTPENLNNKTIKIDLTRQLRGKGLTIKLKIINQKGTLIAIPNSMELSISYIRRIMRKRISYVEDSFKTKCADVQVTIKPFLITRKKVSRVVQKNLRNTTKEFLIEYVKEKDYNQICHEILDSTLQKTMLPKLKKIYPLSFCEIRKFETKELGKINIEKASKIIADQENQIEETLKEETIENKEPEKE